MLKRVSAMLVLLCLGQPAQAAPKITELTASSKWQLNYGDDSCTLAREFKSGDENLILVLDQFSPGHSYRATLIGEPVKTFGIATAEKVAVRFGPSNESEEIFIVGGASDKTPAALLSSAIRVAPLTAKQRKALEGAKGKRPDIEFPVAPEVEKASTYLDFGLGKRKILRLQTEAMDKPLAALRTCAWDSVRIWGLKVEEQQNLRRRLTAIGIPWFSSNDYPDKMVLTGEQGVINTRLMVDATGKPTSCHIQRSTRPKEFDDVVCKVMMKRAKFEPALNAAGQPVPSFWVNTVLFRMAG